ncbi:MAG: O-antigen polymerase [Hellea sp.]
MIKFLLIPPTLFTLIWGVIIYLHSLKLSKILIDLNFETLYLVSMTCVCFYTGFIYYYLLKKGRVNLGLNVDLYFNYFNNAALKRRFRCALIFWFFMSVLEVLIHKNVPLLSAFGIGSYIRYTNFGIPGIHGFLNALYFCLVCYYFLRILIYKSMDSKLILFFLMVWPFLLLHRMMIVALFVQMLIVFLIIHLDKLKFSSLLKVVIGFFSFIFIFGFMGDFRSGREHILRLAQLTFDYPEWLPSGFAWVYIYVTSPINNLINSISHYLYPDTLPIELLSRLVPSVLRDLIFTAFNKSKDIELVSSAFNVSTFYIEILSDFGYVFAPFLFVIIGFASFLIMDKQFNKPQYLLCWVALMYSIIISIFSNHMFHLVFWFEAFFFFILVKGFKLTRNKDLK